MLPLLLLVRRGMIVSCCSTLSPSGNLFLLVIVVFGCRLLLMFLTRLLLDWLLNALPFCQFFISSSFWVNQCPRQGVIDNFDKFQMGLFVTLNSDHLWKGGLQSHTSGWLGAQWSPCLELSRSPSTSKSQAKLSSQCWRKKDGKRISTKTLCDINSPLTTQTYVAPGQFGYNLITQRHHFHLCQDQEAYTTTKVTTTVATHAYTTRHKITWLGVSGCPGV